MIARLAGVVADATDSFERYDYARALERAESFFWWFCDYYLELVKGRRYDPDPAASASVSRALRLSLSVFQRLFAPFLPFVCEEVWSWWQEGSVHRAPWPDAGELAAAAASPEGPTRGNRAVARARRCSARCARPSLRRDARCARRLRACSCATARAWSRSSWGWATCARPARSSWSRRSEAEEFAVEVELAAEDAE